MTISTVSALIGLTLPIVAGTLLKKDANNPVKRIFVLVLVLVAAVIKQAADGNGIISEQMVLDAVGIFVVTVASYLGIYKDTTLASLFPDKGIGTNPF